MWQDLAGMLSLIACVMIKTHAIHSSVIALQLLYPSPQDLMLPENVTATTRAVHEIKGARYAVHALPVQHSRAFLTSIKVCSLRMHVAEGTKLLNFCDRSSAILQERAMKADDHLVWISCVENVYHAHRNWPGSKQLAAILTLLIAMLTVVVALGCISIAMTWFSSDLILSWPGLVQSGADRSDHFSWPE